MKFPGKPGFQTLSDSFLDSSSTHEWSVYGVDKVHALTENSPLPIIAKGQTYFWNPMLGRGRWCWQGFSDLKWRDQPSAGKPPATK